MEAVSASLSFRLYPEELQNPRGLSGKESAGNAGVSRAAGLIPGLGRSPGGRHGNPLQYSCLENPMHRGAWRAIVHRVTKSWTQLKQLNINTTTIYISLTFH